MFDILRLNPYTKSVPGKNSFKALPIFIALIILSVFSVTIFQSFSVDKDTNQNTGQVFGLKDTKLPFPVYPNASILSQTESDGRSYFTFKSSANITTTQQWYKTELLKEGWSPSPNQEIYTKGNERVELSILNNDDKSTLIIINYIY